MDNYKVKTFKKNLKEAGFKWQELPFDKNSILLKVAYEEGDLEALVRIVEKSNGQEKKGKR